MANVIQIRGRTLTERHLWGLGGVIVCFTPVQTTERSTRVWAVVFWAVLELAMGMVVMATVVVVTLPIDLIPLPDPLLTVIAIATSIPMLAAVVAWSGFAAMLAFDTSQRLLVVWTARAARQREPSIAGATTQLW